MTRSQRRAVLLACAGLASATIVSAIETSTIFAILVPGILFGIAVMVVFAFERVASPPIKRIAFVASSAAASFISYFVGTGGLLAVIGWRVGDAIYKHPVTYAHSPFSSVPLVLIWQVGVALCVGAVLPLKKDRG